MAIRTHTAKAFVMASLGLSALIGAPHPSFAGDQPNVLFMGEDADEDTVPRHSRIFNRVDDALRAQMMDLGFHVYNETATTLDTTDPSRVRRTDAELISVAQNVTAAPIDVVVSFQIYASSRDNAYSDIKQLRIRVVGRMLQVQTGRDLGNFEVAVGPRGLKPIPPKCDRDCILEHVGDEAKPIAHEVGAALASKLDDLSPSAPLVPKADAIIKATPAEPTTPAAQPTAAAQCAGVSTAYTIVLDNFEPEVIGDIEQRLMTFQGYETHRPVRSETRSVEYWYETCSDRARLERNLREMLAGLDVKTHIALVNNRFEIERVLGNPKR